MNKRILFLFTDSCCKKEADNAVRAIKTLLRKFRKTASIDYLQLDLSDSCKDKVTEIFKEKTSDIDSAILISSSNFHEEEMYAYRNFGVYGGQHFASGKQIFYSFSDITVCEKDGILNEKHSTDLSHIEKISAIARNAASSRKSGILLCTKDSRLIEKAFEDSLGGTPRINVTHMTLNEFLYSSLRAIPSPEVILTVFDEAELILPCVNSMNNLSADYCVWHSDNNFKFYTRPLLPFRNENTLFSGLLMSVAKMLEDTKDYKSAGIHLKKAVALTLSECKNESFEEFMKTLILKINTPLRNRQVKADDSEN